MMIQQPATDITSRHPTFPLPKSMTPYVADLPLPQLRAPRTTKESGPVSEIGNGRIGGKIDTGLRFIGLMKAPQIFVQVTTWTMTTSCSLLTADGCKLLAAALPFSTVNPGVNSTLEYERFLKCDKLSDKTGLTVSPSRTYSVTIPPENLFKIFARVRIQEQRKMMQHPAIDITARHLTSALSKSKIPYEQSESGGRMEEGFRSRPLLNLGY